MRRILSILYLVFITVIVAGCNDQDAGKVELDTENFFFDYLITAEEGGEIVTCKFQYRQKGPEGEAVRLHDSGRVELDGVVLVPDSSRLNGVYYETMKPLADFNGEHTLVFTSPGGKQYTEKFVFMPFSLENELPQQIRREELTIKLANFPLERTALRLIMTDTAFNSRWINRRIPVVNAEVVITKEILSRLKTGPIGLELHREERKKFQQPSAAGGRFIINYSVKRELELVD